MIKLMKMLPKRIKWIFTLGALLVFLGVLVSLTIPNFISQFIKLLFSDAPIVDHIEVLKNWHIFNNMPKVDVQNKLIIIIALQTTLLSLFTFASTFVFVFAAERSSLFYRKQLFKKLNALSLKNISDLKPESIMTRISNDVAIFWNFLVGGLRMMVKGFIMIVGGATIAFSVDWKMALIILPVIPIMMGVMVAIGKFASPLIKKTQWQVEKVTKEIDENIKGIRTIKTYNLENERLEKFRNSNNTWFKLNSKAATIITSLHPIFFTVNNFIVIGIYMFVRGEYISKTATDNTVVQMNIFIEYLWMIAFGILLITMFLRFAFRAKISAVRIREVLIAKEDKLVVENGIRINNNEDQNLDITIENLNFKYYKDNPNYSLSDINLHIPYKSSLGIIGLFASGKSTLVSLLLNNYVYDEGSIKIGDHEVNQINTKDLLNTVGIVYQDAMLFSGTIRSNMQWAKPDATDEEINTALKNACAYDFVYKFGDNLDHKITQGATNISGGQKQRLSIARSLLRKPKILILDDSTSALDNITTKQVIENITKNYKCTTILISQKIGALKNCENIIVMDSGKIIAKGKHEQLVESSPFYAQIHKSQLEL
ncbi:ABC transporter ATP-binding protein/permease [Mycoplasma sp. CSL7475-4]|uniref:ABC transporter ATP-binding protein n=1 Tax=Mycoplasma sp. CSL7475-4 TaxID=2973942 RepID=UPI00216AE499|nr:ABC transporter ATP-binding protein [Mycoplasma sp. CSL7475-4]MCS4536845.1 ABC transporter ATP-binding protein/permease [Mycoplasma sp. CSL7475-4]